MGMLRSHDISHTAIGSAGTQAIGGGAHRLPRLTHLHAPHCHIGDAGLRGLMQSPLLAQLTELNLSGNDLTTRGVRQLVEQIEEWKGEGVSVNDRSLDLSRNRLGLAGQQALRGLRPMVWID